MTAQQKPARLSSRQLGMVLANNDKSIDASGASYDEPYSAAWQHEIKALMDLQTLKSLFFGEPWVFITVDTIASMIADLELGVFRLEVTGGDEAYVPAFNHPVQRVLDDPNPLQDKTSFLYSVIVDDTLCGNAFVWRAFSLRQMWHLPVERVTYDIDEKGIPRGIFYSRSSIEDGIAQATSKLHFLPDEIMHSRRANPSSAIWGLSPFVPGRKSVLFDRYSQDYLNSFFLKGATSQIALKVNRELSEDQARRLLRTFESAYTGRGNMRRTMLLPKDVDATPFQTSMSDNQLPELVNMNRDTVLNLLKIPRHVVSLQEAGSLGSQEMKAALKWFWQATLLPVARRIAANFDRLFREQLGNGFCIRFDLENIPALAEDEMMKADLAQKLKGVLTVNEIRQRLYDLEPVEGGNSITPQAAQPQPVFQMMRGMDDGQRVSDEGISGESEPSGAGSASDGGRKEKALAYIGKKGAILKDIEADAAARWQSRQGAEWTEFAAEALVDQYALIIDALADEGKRLKAMDDETRAKIDKNTADLKEQVAKLPESQRTINPKAFREKVSELLKTQLSEKYAKRHAALSFGPYEMGYNAGIRLVVNEKNQELIDTLRKTDLEGKRETLAARGLDSFAKISETTTEEVMKVVEDGVKNKQDIRKIGEQIAATAEKITPKRAMTIARTEVLTASSAGQSAMQDDYQTILEQIAEAEGRQPPRVVKIWVTAQDDRVRSDDNPDSTSRDFDHAAMHGEMVDYDEPFSVPSNKGPEDLMYPRDTAGSPGNVINCFVAETKFESESVQKSMMSTYEGQLVTVKFSDGTNITGTPNHPVLTVGGWVRLCDLQKGQELFKAKAVDHSLSQNDDLEIMKASAEDVHNAILASGSVMSSSCADFHGDKPVDQKVDVVSTASGLRFDAMPVRRKLSHQAGLANSDVLLGLHSRDRSAFDSRVSLFAASGGGVAGGDLSQSLGRTHARPFQRFGSGCGSSLKSMGFKPSIKRGSRNSDALRYLINADTLVNVHTVQVSDIEIGDFKRHSVYNLQTFAGWYLANGIVAHNCRCTWLTVDPEDLGLDRDATAREIMGELNA